MCGIVGIASKEPFTSEELLKRLKKLEYRGYDSYGYWNGTELYRNVGKITVINDNYETNIGICHTRWATNGGVTEANAHPHQAGKVTIVHNGIIENWQELKEELDVTCNSQTDSELIAHFVNKNLDKPMPEVMQRLVEKLKGTFATLIMVEGDNNIYAAKRDSPLVLGICEGKLIAASDIYAFSDCTTKAIFFENDEYAVIGNTYTFYKNGEVIEKNIQEFSWETQEKILENYPHYMLKEIHEQPVACQRLITSLQTGQQDKFKKLIELMKNAEKVVFTAAGTAYHASLLGAAFLHQQGVDAQAIIASEFENFITVDKNTLVIAVSQSGETMDVVEALKYSAARGATISSIVNVPYSTIERMSSISLQIHAGQEVAVASTKAFVNQVTLLLAVAKAFGYTTDLESLPSKIEETLQHESQIKALAEVLHRHNDLYIIGRKLGYPIAREIALKIKEVSYVHAEGMMAGELKHGTIALIEPGTPVISLIFNNDTKMRNSTQEVAARGARTIIIGEEISLPAKNEAEFCILAAIIGQLLAYHIADARKLPIDKPRNLAKSVTVL